MDVYAFLDLLVRPHNASQIGFLQKPFHDWIRIEKGSHQWHRAQPGDLRRVLLHLLGKLLQFHRTWRGTASWVHRNTVGRDENVAIDHDCAWEQRSELLQLGLQVRVVDVTEWEIPLVLSAIDDDELRKQSLKQGSEDEQFSAAIFVRTSQISIEDYRSSCPPTKPLEDRVQIVSCST